MKTKLIMLDTPIIVSDEEIKEGDWYVRLQHIIGKDTDLEFNIDIDIFQRKTSTRNKELFISEGWINGIKNGLQHNCNLIHCKKIIAGIEGLPSIDWNGLEEEFGYIDVEKYSNTYRGHQPSFEEGFKQAQSLNDKKFSLEDMKKAIEIAQTPIETGIGDYYPNISEIIQSLQQPKIFDIEGILKNNTFKILKKI